MKFWQVPRSGLARFKVGLQTTSTSLNIGRQSAGPSMQVVYIERLLDCSEQANQKKQNIRQHRRRIYVRNDAYSNKTAMLMPVNVGS